MHKVIDLKGDLHVHTSKAVCETHLGLLIEEYDEVCGNLPLNEVIESARDRTGMLFIGITNHSSYPLDPDPDPRGSAKRVQRQLKDVRRYCEQERGIEILAGAEVNILPDGRIDVDNTVLKSLDFVVASMHFLEDLDGAAIEANYISAIRQPHVKVIGHVNRNISALKNVNWERVVAASVEHRCALEFNVAAQLTDELIELVVKHGSIVTLGSDAHLSDTMKDYTQHLIGPRMDSVFLYDALSRLAEVPKSQIVNFWEPREVTAWIKEG